MTGTLGYMAPEMVLLLNHHHRKQQQQQANKQRQQSDDGAVAAAVAEDYNNKHHHHQQQQQQWTALRQSKGYTTAVDWWSLGCTMFKLLTGGRPFVDSDPSDIVPVSGD